MSRFFLHIYDFLSKHRVLTAAGLLLFCCILAVMALRVNYEEDIAKFLPMSKDKQELADLSKAAEKQSRIAILFSEKDSAATTNTDSLEEAMEAVGEQLATLPQIKNLQVSVDESQMEKVLDLAYRNAPYFLTDKDQRRIEKLLADSSYIREQLEKDKQQLIVSNGMAMTTLKYDPLHLFDPLMKRLQRASPAQTFQIIDGYLFTKDGKHSMITFNSPYGSSETHKNAELAETLDSVLAKSAKQYPSLRITAIGAPLVAVTNAQQIKTDSLLASGAAVFLILGLLIWHYRRVQDILWIGISIAFGWLFALAGMSLFNESVSIIVLGVGSVIIGIAVNYPLHFLDHIREAVDKRDALNEMVPPLLIGNITTVAAFLCLIFLDAQAMRDLGLFGGMMLIGTILFVLIFLPVFASIPKNRSAVHSISFFPESWMSGRLSFLKGLRSKTPVFISVCVITLVLGYFSLQTSFDSNLQHINYMTAEQKEDMAIMTGGEAIKSTPFIEKKASYEYGLKWSEEMQAEFDRQVGRLGFSNAAFEPFKSIVSNSHPLTKKYEDFQPILNELETPDTKSAATQLVEVLNDSFNYVGFVCGFVVFFFLWVSFRRIELSLMSFLPLAVSWIWILGLMELFGVQFNIVNIILATFIFGQGDDYTIFITEGLLYEYTTGKKRLDSYKKSVMMSAVLMFIGIGSLVFASHPALKSLGAVTVIGMATVVLMAYYLSPLVFKWLVRGRDSHFTKEDIPYPLPLTIKRFVYSLGAMIFFLCMMYLFVLPYTWFYFHFGKVTEERKVSYHALIQFMSRWTINHVPGVKMIMENRVGETFDKPAIVVCNHQSHLDIMCLLMLTPKIIFLTNDWVWHNPFYGGVIHHAEYLPVSDGIAANVDKLRDLYNRGYSICIFPEGTRSVTNQILRFHKGPFYLAQQLGADVLPVFIHGVGHVLPKKDFMLRQGSIYVEVQKRIKLSEIIKEEKDSDLALLRITNQIHHYYKEHYKEICDRIETEEYIDNYRKLSEYYQMQ